MDDYTNFTGTVTVNGGTNALGGAGNGTSFILSSTNDMTVIGDNGIWYSSDLASWDFHDLKINGDVTFKPSGLSSFTVSSSGVTTITDGVTIVSESNYSDPVSDDGVGLHFDLSGAVTLPVNATITATETGYLGGSNETNGSGPGGGSGGGAGGGGAGHGGVGGNSEGGTSGGSKDSSRNLGLGSGGGGGHSAASASWGGSGGGSIQISVDGSLDIDGVIESNGGEAFGKACASVGQPGGGSGGSIYISANSVSGSGSLFAVGGGGGAAGDDRCYDGGNGSGGIITIVYSDSFNWTGTSLDSSVATASGTKGWEGEDGIVN